jgi:hypothetical protein
VERKMYSSISIIRRRRLTARTQRAHSSRSYLGRRCRVGLRQAHPDLSCRPRYEKKAKTGAKTAMPAPLAWVLAHCPQYTVKRAAPRLHARR